MVVESEGAGVVEFEGGGWLVRGRGASLIDTVDWHPHQPDATNTTSL